ncbi:SRPBCC family protein [Cellulomonas sp. GbtcB1]|uniref:SRPBCC family protein n=1 Tax=Cellulomonas sp. GbtcB1 TaxID=2824746 RepID=UPI001C308B07|nr:SRPBCC family protein [Cellulomonas sp. GbtcB1]
MTGTDGTTGRAAGGDASPRTGGPAGATAPAGVGDPLGALRLGGEASVTFRRRYPTDAADLWDAVTTPERLARWLGPVHGELVRGGTYELRMGADEAGSDQNATGVVRSCDPPRAFAVEWCFPGERASEVEVRVEPDAAGEGAVLVLVHTRLEDAQAIGYGAGWHTSLDQLADHLAGADVRDWDTRFAALLPAYRALAER